MDEGEILKELMKQARKKLPDFDTIIDLFDMCFVFISKKSAEMSGYTPNEMIGESIHGFMNIPSSDKESFQDILMKTMVGGNVEIPIKTKDGKELNVLMNFVTIEIDNHPFIITKATENI